MAVYFSFYFCRMANLWASTRLIQRWRRLTFQKTFCPRSTLAVAALTSTMRAALPREGSPILISGTGSSAQNSSMIGQHASKAYFDFYWSRSIPFYSSHLDAEGTWKREILSTGTRPSLTWSTWKCTTSPWIPFATLWVPKLIILATLPEGLFLKYIYIVIIIIIKLI